MLMDGSNFRLKEESVELSVVIPVYGCANCLENLHARLVATLERAVDSFEIVFVDDRSPDSSWPVLARLASEDDRIVAIRLSRNFGQHMAITAGLAESCGQWIAVMDCDLQDPPEVIPQLLAEAHRGADIVLARREGDYQSALRIWANRLYFWFLSVISGMALEGKFGASLFSRKVAQAFLQFQDIDRHYLSILRWLGFETRTITYSRDRRSVGASSYTFARVVALALSGIFFQTTVFLHWVIYAGFAISILGFLLGLFFIWSYLFGNPPGGWTSTVVIQLFVGGLIIISIGTVGLYIGRIFEQTKGRPLYVIDRRIDKKTAHLPDQLSVPIAQRDD